MNPIYASGGGYSFSMEMSEQNPVFSAVYSTFERANNNAYANSPNGQLCGLPESGFRRVFARGNTQEWLSISGSCQKISYSFSGIQGANGVIEDTFDSFASSSGSETQYTSTAKNTVNGQLKTYGKNSESDFTVNNLTTKSTESGFLCCDRNVPLSNYTIITDKISVPDYFQGVDSILSFAVEKASTCGRNIASFSITENFCTPKCVISTLKNFAWVKPQIEPKSYSFKLRPAAAFEAELGNFIEIKSTLITTERYENVTTGSTSFLRQATNFFWFPPANPSPVEWTTLLEEASYNYGAKIATSNSVLTAFQLEKQEGFSSKQTTFYFTHRFENQNLLKSTQTTITWPAMESSESTLFFSLIVEQNEECNNIYSTRFQREGRKFISETGGSGTCLCTEAPGEGSAANDSLYFYSSEGNSVAFSNEMAKIFMLENSMTITETMILQQASVFLGDNMFYELPDSPIYIPSQTSPFTTIGIGTFSELFLYGCGDDTKLYRISQTNLAKTKNNVATVSQTFRARVIAPQEESSFFSYSAEAILGSGKGTIMEIEHTYSLGAAQPVVIQAKDQAALGPGFYTISVYKGLEIEDKGTYLLTSASIFNRAERNLVIAGENLWANVPAVAFEEDAYQANVSAFSIVNHWDDPIKQVSRPIGGRKYYDNLHLCRKRQ